MFNPIISCKKNVETYTLPPIWRHFNYHLSIPLHVHPKKIGSSQLSPIPRSETALCHLDVQRSKSTGKTRVFSSSVGFEVSTASSCTTTFTFFSGFCSITSWGEQWVEVDESIRGETSLVNQKQKKPNKTWPYNGGRQNPFWDALAAMFLKLRVENLQRCKKYPLVIYNSLLLKMAHRNSEFSHNYFPYMV